MANPNPPLENLKPFTGKDDPRNGIKPKGSIHLSTRIRNMMEDENFEQKLKDGTILKGQPIEAILKVAIAKARTGDIRFLEWLAKYGWGQKLDITTGGDKIQPVTIIDLGALNVSDQPEAESSGSSSQES